MQLLTDVGIQHLHDRIDRADPTANLGQHLLLALDPVGEVRRKERGGILDRIAVRRPQDGVVTASDFSQRVDVGPHVAVGG